MISHTPITLSNNNTYFRVLRAHLSRKKETWGSRSRPGSDIGHSFDEDNVDDDTMLRPTSSHNRGGTASSRTSVSIETPQTSPSLGQRSDKARHSRNIRAIAGAESPSTCPNRESSLIRRGAFKGLTDMRTSDCAFNHTKSLSHCTFRNCYCMRRPIVPSPLRHSLVVDESGNGEGDDENLSIGDNSGEELSSLSDKIRQISWIKPKTIMDPTSINPKSEWTPLESIMSSEQEVKLVETPPRLKKLFLHDNFKRIVSHKAPVGPETEILVLPLNISFQARFGSNGLDVESIVQRRRSIPL